MKKGVLNKTLQNKCNFWKKILMLDDWHIICKYATKTEIKEIQNIDKKEGIEYDIDDYDWVGYLYKCSLEEKCAVILIDPLYSRCENYGHTWNIDTLIIHELLHIICKEGKHRLPASLIKHKKWYDFEEFLVNRLAIIIYKTKRKNL